MIDQDTQKILVKLEEHEKRIMEVENKLQQPSKLSTLGTGEKQQTLAELIRGKEFSSGQEKITVIVGYYEKIIQKNLIKEGDLRAGWKEGKFDKKYNPELLARALKVGWVRNIDSVLDLSQSGEEFFATFMGVK